MGASQEKGGESSVGGGTTERNGESLREKMQLSEN